MVGKEAQGKGSFFFLAPHLGKYMNILPAPKNSQKDIPQYPHFWLLELQQKNHEKPGITSTLHGSPTAPLQHTKPGLGLRQPMRKSSVVTSPLFSPSNCLKKVHASGQGGRSSTIEAQGNCGSKNKPICIGLYINIGILMICL